MKEKDEPFKVELIEDLPADAEISFYDQDGFVDLCAGPHLMNTKGVKAYKLISSSTHNHSRNNTFFHTFTPYTPPKRRLRLLKSSIAFSKSFAVKSGHKMFANLFNELHVLVWLFYHIGYIEQHICISQC